MFRNSKFHLAHTIVRVKEDKVVSHILKYNDFILWYVAVTRTHE